MTSQSDTKPGSVSRPEFDARYVPIARPEPRLAGVRLPAAAMQMRRPCRVLIAMASWEFLELVSFGGSAAP